MSETWSTALIDCEASKTVCRKELFNQHVNKLCEEDQKQMNIVKVFISTNLTTETKFKAM